MSANFPKHAPMLMQLKSKTRKSREASGQNGRPLTAAQWIVEALALNEKSEKSGTMSPPTQMKAVSSVSVSMASKRHPTSWEQVYTEEWCNDAAKSLCDCTNILCASSVTCRSNAKTSSMRARADGLPAAADKAVETPLKNHGLDQDSDDDEDEDDHTMEDDNKKEWMYNTHHYVSATTGTTSEWCKAQLRLEWENHGKKKFIQEQQEESGNIQDPDTTAHMLRSTVCGTIFGSIKFANDEKYFLYLPEEEESDWERGMLFRAIKKGCSMLPRDEESWWNKQRRAVKEALKRKRSTVSQGLKYVMRGEYIVGGWLHSSSNLPPLVY
jgi:hypothetical protein